MKFDTLTYRDPTAVRRPHRVPTLKKLEQRLYNSLLKVPGTYTKKSWLATRRAGHAKILHGTKKQDPNSGDIDISLWYEDVALDEKVSDLLED